MTKIFYFTEEENGWATIVKRVRKYKPRRTRMLFKALRNEGVLKVIDIPDERDVGDLTIPAYQFRPTNSNFHGLDPDMAHAYTVTVQQIMKLHGSKVRLPSDQDPWKVDFRRMVTVDFKDIGGLPALISVFRWLFTSRDADAIFWRRNVYSIPQLRKPTDGKLDEPKKILKIHTAYLANNPGATSEHKEPVRSEFGRIAPDIMPLRQKWVEAVEKRGGIQFLIPSAEHKAISIASHEEGAKGFLGVSTGAGCIYVGYGSLVGEQVREKIRDRTRSFFDAPTAKVIISAPKVKA